MAGEEPLSDDDVLNEQFNGGKRITDKEAFSQGMTIIRPRMERQSRAFEQEAPHKATAYLLWKCYFTIREICTLLKISKRTANYWITELCVKYGRRKRF